MECKAIVHMIDLRARADKFVIAQIKCCNAIKVLRFEGRTTHIKTGEITVQIKAW